MSPKPLREICFSACVEHVGESYSEIRLKRCDECRRTTGAAMLGYALAAAAKRTQTRTAGKWWYELRGGATAMEWAKRLNAWESAVRAWPGFEDVDPTFERFLRARGA